MMQMKRCVYTLSNTIKTLIFILWNVTLYQFLMIMNIVHKWRLNYLIKKMIPWESFLVKVIDDFKDKGFNFNHLAEMHIITIANKMDMSYDFFKHKMHAVQWKLNAMINTDKSLINKIYPDWRHPWNRKFETYCVWLIRYYRFFYNDI